MEQSQTPQAEKKMNGGLIAMIVVIILIGGYYLANRQKTAGPTAQPSPTPAAATAGESGAAKKVVVTAIDANASEIGFDFSSKFHTGSGRFAKLTAQGSFDRTDWTKLSAELLIDAASIETGIAIRDNHLKSEDFFDVKTYPTLVYQVTKAELDEKKLQFNVAGDLTIRGKTKSVTAPVSVLENPDGSVTLKGSLVINRRDWGDFKYDGSNPINPVDNEIPLHITLVYR